MDDVDVHPRLPAEQHARVLIDRQLAAAGWLVQDRRQFNLFAGDGVAVRETIMAPGHGRADYLLYVGKRAVGVIEAKPMGTPLSGVEWQSAKYAQGLPAEVRRRALTVDAQRGSAPSADRSGQRYRTRARRAALRALIGADGHRRRQDVYRRHRVISAAQARRVQTHPVPGRSQQSWRPDTARVPELRHTRRRQAPHPAIQRRQTHQRRRQYFTPRPLIQAMVDCVRPTPSDTVIDPAAGTGGFLLAAHEYAAAQAKDLTPDEREHLRDGLVHRIELVDGAARLAAMNLILHGIGKPNGPSLIEVKDALLADSGHRYSLVLSNPPFGRKSSPTMVGADGREAREDREIERQDFVVTTSNKQLNFLQHIATILSINGRAAVVLPDNVLFEGGAGETLRRKLLADFELHTMLRLPTGIFYAQGVKANVLFFDKKPASEQPWTRRLWVYDLRTNQHFTLKQNPLRRAHLDDFVACYAPGQTRS